MEMSPPSEATSRSAIQEFPNIFFFWNPKVIFHVHKDFLLLSILSQMNLVRTTSVSKIPHACHMPCPSYRPWLSLTMQRKYVSYAGFCTNV
jgi:hypothetical protein